MLRNHKWFANISKFQFDPETVRRKATPWIPLKFLLFIYYSFIWLDFWLVNEAAQALFLTRHVV